VYQGLTHPREFRLLLLQPGLFGEPIRCNLVHKMFSTMTPIEYEAISYTWADESGDSTPSKTIYLGGCLFSVTPNCEAVLKRVRARGRLRVWIDAVCINQHDTDERGHQVHLMPDIYSLAERVLIYPGELSDKEAKNLETLNSLDVSNTARVGHFPPSPTGLSPLQKTVLDAVDRVAPSFFKRRYFSRVWILQEVSLAREALVLCDGYEISLDYFRTSAIYKARSEAPRVLRIEPRKFRQESDLLELLNDARDSKATDSRDKVFGVFGMIQLASQSFGLVANYNASVEDTYIEAALNIAETLSRTDGRGILKLIVRAMGPRNYPALPAWVPDWSAVPYPEVVQTLPAAPLDVYHDYPRLQNVIVDKRQREISFNGAQFCSLEK
ncbi:heterokaryon incompatibility protein-domain-containing protein, partial [Cladorrhinum sp. PSN332]